MLVHEAPKHIEKLVNHLDSHHAYEMQRVTVAAVFAQVRHIVSTVFVLHPLTA